MNRCPYPAKVLLLGLFATQVLATIQVYLSNAHLYRALIAIRDAGYLTIPNQRMIHNLGEFGPAFFGGLFFTFSVGAGVSLLSLAAAWIWDRLVSRKKLFLVLLLLSWIGCVVAVNRQGLCPVATSYFLLIPPLVFAATSRWMPPKAGQGVWLYRMVVFSPALVLALLWIPQIDTHLFVEFRDNLLLSNPLGTKINDFYYAYTLYPAEVFKSLDQKILKTCDLQGIQEGSTVQSMERELLNHDFLPVRAEVAVDLKIAEEANTLVFERRRRTILRSTVEDFLANPEAVLGEFSSKTDRYAFFRRFTFFSLLIGFPVSLYLLLYGLFRLVSGFFLDVRASSVVASTLCFLTGITVLVFFYQTRVRTTELRDVAEALKSERWRDRVAALKIIEHRGMEVADFQVYQSMLKSPHIPERYWLVRALGVSRQSETYNDLLASLDDPHPNVVSMAFYALGQRGDSRAVKEILRRIETSDDWYNQWYAYKALRILGWKQTRSK